jgi:hypothetical protein
MMNYPTIEERLKLKIIQDQYKVNELFIATEPLVWVVINTKHFYADVKAAKYNGVWEYGYKYHIKFGANPGGGHLPNFDPEFNDQEECSDTMLGAVNKGLNRLLEIFERVNPGKSNYVCEGDDDAPNKGHELDKSPAIAAIKLMLNPAPKQLELF